MTTIIFKNENKAKVYEIYSAKKQGVYSENELIRRVKTDKIDMICADQNYEVFVKVMN